MQSTPPPPEVSSPSRRQSSKAAAPRRVAPPPSQLPCTHTSPSLCSCHLFPHSATAGDADEGEMEVYEGFEAILLAQNSHLKTKEFPTFDAAMADFFEKVGDVGCRFL